jgi:phosphotriesterase-related protein
MAGTEGAPQVGGSGPIVMTVLGPVPPEEIGVTLTHEHLYMDGTVASTSSSGDEPALDCATAAEARWNPLASQANLRFTDIDLIVDELRLFTAAGGRTIVDVTPVPLGRDPRALVEISLRSGIHAVMGGGHYTWPFHPERVVDRSVEELASEFIDEIVDGVGDSDVRPGVMGEVGASDPLADGERKLLRAHALAARETGVAITIHQQSWGRNGHEVLDEIVAEGISPDRVVMGHMTPVIDDDSYQSSLLDRGAFLGYDFLGIDHSIFAYGRVPPDPPGRYPPNDYDVLIKIRELIGRGYSDRILLSGDNGELIRMRRYGGWGYAHILDHLVPLMEALGIDPGVSRSILTDNPRRILTVAGR